MYTQSATQLLCDLVNQANPRLPIPFTPQNVALIGKPEAATVNGEARTRATFLGLPGKGLVGELPVYYYRIDLTALFRGAVPTVRPERTVTNYGELLTAVNDTCGLNLTPADILTPEKLITLTSQPQAITISASNSSHCFTGSFLVNCLPAPVGYFPNSGPGTKYLMAGDSQNGYFGTVSQGELFDSVDMAKRLYPSDINSSGYNFLWLKFFLQGKVVYIASHGVFDARWSDLYNAGLVFGVDGPGERPTGITTPVDQIAYMTKREKNTTHYLRVSLPFYQTGQTPNVQTPAAEGSIWKLLKKLQKGGEWGELVGGYFAPNDSMWTRSTSGVDRAWYQSWSNTTLVATAFTANIPWAPQLELVDPKTIVLPLTDVEYKLVPPASPVATTAENPEPIVHPLTFEFTVLKPLRPLPTYPNQPLVVKPLALLEPTVESARPVVTVAKQTLATIHPIGLSEPHTDGPRPVAVKASRAKPKINLSTTNGELNGFR